MLGSGTLEDPYQITTEEELQSINNTSAHYKLMNDLYMSNKPFTPIVSFSGVFDGNWKKIYNLKININQEYVGLFGYMYNATVRNLGIENIYVETLSYGKSVGSLVGHADNCIIDKVYSTGSVRKYSPTTSIVESMGGLIGLHTTGTTTNSYSHCHNIAGYGYAGGFVGRINSGTVTNCYATGNLSNMNTSRKGGFTGSGSPSSVINCYWDSESTSTTSGSSYGGLPRTTAEMKSPNYYTFVDWDFANVWKFNGYPVLKGFGTALNVSVGSYASVLQSSSDRFSEREVELNSLMSNIYSGTLTTKESNVALNSFIQSIDTDSTAIKYIKTTSEIEPIYSDVNTDTIKNVYLDSRVTNIYSSVQVAFAPEENLVVESFKTFSLAFKAGSKANSVKLYLNNIHKKTFVSDIEKSFIYNFNYFDLLFGDNLVKIEALDADGNVVSSKSFNMNVADQDETENTVIIRGKKYKVMSKTENDNGTLDITLDRSLEKTIAKHELIELYQEGFIPFISNNDENYTQMNHVKTLYRNGKAVEEWEHEVNGTIIHTKVIGTQGTLQDVKQAYHDRLRG